MSILIDSNLNETKERKAGKKALRVKDGELETFDPHLLKRDKMKTYKLAEAERLLEEIREFLDDNMGWITQGGKQEMYIPSKDLFILSNEMKVVHDKIQKYLREE